MSTFLRRGLVTVLLAGSASTALAGPLHTTDERGGTLFRYDISFQDGRTQSQIGTGIPNARGIVNTGDPEDLGPIAACWAEGSNPTVEQMASLEAAIHSSYESRYFIGARWNQGVTGDPITLTWSFAPDGLSIPGGVGEATSNNVLFARFDALFGSRAVWINHFDQCFERWGALSGLNYTRVRNAALNDWDDGAAWGSAGGTFRGEVRIACHPIDGANNILAYNSFPQAGDMVLDSAEAFNAGGSNALFLRNTIMHEHGHGLGFNHVCPLNNTKLMEPQLSTAFDGPQQDEVRAAQANYGDLFEPNNSTATATTFGALSAGSNVTLGTIPAPTVANASQLSIDAATESDWFLVNLPEPRLLDITVTPFGTSYLSLPQNGNGSCPTSGTADNALAAGNLQVQVYKQNGTSSLRLANATAAGSAESISGLLAASGNSYIKVTVAGGTLTGTQFYKINLVVRSTSLIPNASNGTFADMVRVTWPTIPDATSYQVYRNTNDLTFGGTTVGTVAAPLTTFDDTTAVPGTDYFYFVKALQPDDTGYRLINESGDPGRRDAAPVANAGPDITVTDTDSSGFEQVLLDGSASTDADGPIIIYRWYEGATLLSQLGTPTFPANLSVGDHTITLVVLDGASATGTDDVIVHVVPPASGCGTSDFDGDGDSGTDADIQAFFACLGGDCCPTCFAGGSDFDGDGDAGTDCDITNFFRVLAGNACGPC